MVKNKFKGYEFDSDSLEVTSTRAFFKFLKIYGYKHYSVVEDCFKAFKNNDVNTALKRYQASYSGEMSDLSYWQPTPRTQEEDTEYLVWVRNALFRDWMLAMQQLVQCYDARSLSKFFAYCPYCMHKMKRSFIDGPSTDE